MHRSQLLLLPALLAAACIENNLLPPEGPDYPPGEPVEVEPPVKTDVIVQLTRPTADILWVIDNSSSMDDDQQALIDNYPIFLDYFLGSGLDYHIGSVNTDTADAGQLTLSHGVRWIDETTEAPYDVFRGMALLGSNGGCERGLATSYGALEIQKNNVNAGFLREDSSLHVVIISDEPDQSDGVPVTAGEYISWFTGIRPDPETRSFSAIANPAPYPDCASVGVNYFNVANELSGVAWDIADREWAAILEQLGIQASGMKREYFLSELPVEETIAVSVISEGITFSFVEGPLGEGDYEYSTARNSITFHEYMPPPLAEVHITYTLRSFAGDDVIVTDTAP